MIFSWNRGAHTLFDYRDHEAIGKAATDLFSDSSEFADQLNLALSGQSIESVEMTCRTKNERDLDVCLSLSPIYEGDRVAGVSAIFRDITERKIAEKRVTEFYSTVSHELRTPLTSIRGALGLLEGGIVDPGSTTGMEMIQLARTSSDRLIRLISDILDLRKIEAGRFELKLEPVPCAQLVCGAVEGIAGMAAEANVRLSLLPISDWQITCDWDRCTQILTNLISNAIKFSGKDTLVVVGAQPGSTADHIRFSVTDNGPGISQADLGKLFHKFQQLDSSDTRAYGGSGLGLAISKALVERHHGKIGVTSQPGKGSTFWFELPVLQPAANETPAMVA
jgi:PAS domain S-box-containing protein